MNFNPVQLFPACARRKMQMISNQSAFLLISSFNQIIFACNYRPISVLPVLSKIMEKAVYTQLIEYLETNKLLTNFQFGYRAKRSTESAATLFVDDVRREVDTGKLVGAVFMDLSRAFDTVSHGVLLQKLKAYGVREQEILWFSDYLFHRTQIVEIDNVTSSPFPLLSGVPQGSILGPLLFIIYFNDLPDSLIRAKVIVYADDTVIYFADHDINNIEMTLNIEMKSCLLYTSPSPRDS